MTAQNPSDTEAALKDEFSTTQPSSKKMWFLLITSVFLLFVATSIGFWLYIQHTNLPPADFPVNEPLTIAPGTSVKTITEELATANVVRSATLLYYSLVLFHEPTDIKASTYIFTEPLTTRDVASRLTEGDFDTDLVSVTFVEGERAQTYGVRAEAVLPDFSAETFTNLAEPLEGKLFPETYFIPADFTEEDLLALMTDTFEEQLAPYQAEIETNPLTLDQILTLASIVEREANSPESMQMVAGIFMNRMEIGMPLQADASIEYVIDTPLGELPAGQLATELRERESPYNTYLNPGLPPTPIGNPGLNAITAVLQPTESEYFYYITGNDGEFYYAETLREHNVNISRHLR